MHPVEELLRCSVGLIADIVFVINPESEGILTWLISCAI